MPEALSYPDPPLCDDVVTLRPWTTADVACVQAASRDPHIREGTTVPADRSVPAAQAYIERQRRRAPAGEGRSLVIARRESDEAVGLLWLGTRPQLGVVGLGYWVVPSARQQGLATHAVRLATGWALCNGTARVEAWVEPSNEASQRVLVRTGFLCEGTLRSFLAFDSRRADALVYSRIAAG